MASGSSPLPSRRLARIFTPSQLALRAPYAEALAMLSHLSLGVSDLQRSRVFYDAIVAALGFERVWTGEGGLGYGLPGQERLNLFARIPPEDPGGLAAGPGFHLALVAGSPQQVDDFHAAALASGGRCNGAPGPRPIYGETYYAAFVLDPDGHRLEAVHQ